MATTIASPSIRLNFRGANFFKGLLSAKNRFRSFFRDIKKTTERGMKGSNSSLVSGLTISRGVLIGFLSFATVSIFAKLFNVVKSVFTKIPRLVAEAGIEMEKGLVEVQKAVDLTDDQMGQLRKQLVNFARVTPITTKQLLEIAAAGARMGVALDRDGNIAADATQRLVAFAKSVAKADIAIEELSTEEIGRGIGKLLNLFELGVDKTDNLTSALNSAAQTSAAFANEILNAVTRSAGAARQFKFTAAEAIAVSTTMIELGRTAEITGSSFERLLNIISKTKDFEKFGKFLNITGEQFRKLIDSSPLEVMRSLFIQLGKIKNVTDANKALTTLFGSNVRLTGSVRGLAQGVRLLDKNLRIETEAFEKATSINKEFALVMGTVDSKLKTLSGSFTTAFIELFVKIKPAINSAIDSLFDVSKAFTALTQDESFITFIKNLIADFGNLTRNVGLFFVKLVSVFTKADALVGGTGFFAVLAEQVKDFTKSLRVEDFTLIIKTFNVFKIVLEGIVSAFTAVGKAVAKTKSIMRTASSFLGEFLTLSQEGKEAFRRQRQGRQARLDREEKARKEAAKKEIQRVEKLFAVLKTLTGEEKKKLNIKKEQTKEDQKQVELTKEKTMEARKQATFSKSVLDAQREKTELDAQTKRDLEEKRKNERERKRRPGISDEEAEKLLKKAQKEDRERFKRRSRIIVSPELQKEFAEKSTAGPQTERFKRTQRALTEGQLESEQRGRRNKGRFGPTTGAGSKFVEEAEEQARITFENSNLTAEEMARLVLAFAKQREGSEVVLTAVQRAAQAAAGTLPRRQRGP